MTKAAEEDDQLASVGTCSLGPLLHSQQQAAHSQQQKSRVSIMSSSGGRYASVGGSDDPTTPSVVKVATADRKRRYIQRDGSCRVAFLHVPGRWGLYFTDIFTTLVEIRWRVMFLIFSLSYILSWLLFGLLFWVIALAHDDVRDLSTEPCVDNVRSFTAAFLFSLETQTTIGYGFRGMTENCALAIAVVTVQDVLSCFIDTVVIGIAVAKMASARKRAQTVGFSSTAVVSQRDGCLCLSWRVGDFRRNHMVEGVARAQLVRLQPTASGEVGVSYTDLPLQQSDALWREDFELVVSFTYTGDSTGILHQSRSSYTPAQILWGHVFQDALRVKTTFYKVDYRLFHQTVRVPLPELSAEEQDRLHPIPNKEHQNATPVLPNGQAHEAPKSSPALASPALQP
ncbi:hypothetical protein AGOR_G00195720 [Albula goreensis]|uniref:Inward rectifier potassium channel 16 n=1 Tax=Albula goreensis TaxID=1534307 RepID=A0A8T3CT50_9TELE|nr:hypothetical protein AGOR_G00195720 [Albula goreensis]